jgi:hypothetical protein
MNRRFASTITASIACALAIWGQAAMGQSFSSGSTGADGPLNAPAGTTNITVRPGGVYHHTTVNIQGTLNYLKGTDKSPVVILATGDVTIDGTISLDGANAVNPGGGVIIPGGVGGPGGFNGGNASFSGGSPPINVLPTAGLGPGGGAAANGTTVGAAGGSYGAPTSFVLLTPLFGGSGGGGGQTGAGGGGGGAILIASTTRIVFGTFGLIRANGGSGLTNFSGQACGEQANAGAGGAIRLVAPTITGAGRLQAIRGSLLGNNCGLVQPTDGRIRVEAFSVSGFTGSAIPAVSVANAPGAVSAAGNPALTNVPTLQIASIGGQAVPTVPAASYATPDVALAPGTPNPIAVVLNATNTPVGGPTVITVRLIPQGAASSVAVQSADHTGTFANSSATANVTLAVGRVTVLQAHAAMTLTGQTASLFPLIDGEPVERVEVAATPGQPSTLSLVTKSGKERRLEEMPIEDQMRVAQAWDAMKNSRTE